MKISPPTVAAVHGAVPVRPWTAATGSNATAPETTMTVVSAVLGTVRVSRLLSSAVAA